jgi:hypothetical protein
VLDNKSRFEFSKLDVVAILYDKNGNAITVSQASVPELKAKSTKTVYFTWPFPVTNAARVEVIPRFNPFTSKEI